MFHKLKTNQTVP